MSLVVSETPTLGFQIFEKFSDDVVASYSNRKITSPLRGEFLSSLGLDRNKLFVVKQVHGENIVRISHNSNCTRSVMADGLVSNAKNLSLGILTADCLPVFFFDPIKKAIGIAHSGWKGALHGIAPKVIHAFQQNFRSNPKDIQVGFGPCIRVKRYEVGEEFKAMFSGFYTDSTVLGKGFFDLAGFVRNSLIESGVKSENIIDTGHCTYDNNDSFFSYRKEMQTKERILSVISLRRDGYESK